jgi:hypothetical protein
MGCSGMNNCEIHLHFQVFFNGSNANPWVPKWNEVVDPFGWTPWNGHADDWKWPSVPLWKNFSPMSCIPSSGAASLTVGGITASIPDGSVPVGQVVTLSPSSFSSTINSILRSIGKSFTLDIFSDQQQSNLFSNNNADSTSGFTQPVTVTINYSGTGITHFNLSQSSISWYDSINGEWIPESTTINSLDQIATASVYKEGFYDLQAPLVCLNDVTEPYDDFPSLNNVLPRLDSSGTFNRWFDIQKDEDWFGFEVAVGITYTVQTQNLTDGVDTVLTVYQSDGQTVVTSDDNSGGGKASLVAIKAPENTIYFIKVSQAVGSTYGCDSSYQLQITNNLHPVFLPVIIHN